MNKREDLNFDTDESDEDFVPDKLVYESPVSDDESEGSESCEDTEELKKKPVKRKRENKKIDGMKAKSQRQDESGDEDTNTPRRGTRRRDYGERNGKGKQIEKDVLSDEDDKSHTNALWADFLKDVNPPKIEKPSSFSNNDKESSETMRNGNHTKSLSPTVEENNKVVLAEVVSFAGKEVSVKNEIDTSSVKENKAATIKTAKKQPFSRIMPGVGIKRTEITPATGSAPGIGSILNQLGKKKKLSVLEKSQMDWRSFKQSEGIDEQLQTFNKGKDGYLERQDFLQRTDLRQFEIEKNLRQATRRPF